MWIQACEFYDGFAFDAYSNRFDVECVAFSLEFSNWTFST